MSIAVWQHQRLVALAPLYLEENPGGARLLPLGISLSDYLDLLLDPDASAPAAAALAERLAAERTAWRRCDLEELEPGAAAFALPCPRDCREQRAAQAPCPVLALPEDRALAAAVPAPKRRKLRMAARRAARRGSVEIARIARGGAEDALELLFRLHGRRWSGRGEAGVLRDPRVRSFHHEAVPALFAADLIRLYALRIAGRTVGLYYGLLHRGRAFAYLGGFDPDFAFESPGTILLGHAIEAALAENAREFHFLRGGEAYKFEWGAVDRWNSRRSFLREDAADG